MNKTHAQRSRGALLRMSFFMPRLFQSAQEEKEKMGIFTLIMLALGLAMDAKAVSVSNGICYQKAGGKQVVTYAFLFGLFQMGMPLIGYAAGRAFSDTISYLDHWVALVLLGFIGGKMIWESIKEMREGDSCPVEKQLTLRMMLMQAVATSIDALAVGVGFAVMKVNIWAATASIGIITFGCSLAGTWLGRKFGMILGRCAEIFGGGILVIIGLKIFIEHMFFS